ncbi:bifunctional [glutamine synthetase] adenylyltransferase/[glutamine synthetase]-adenylyl-L-tyrosine phosphorylase [Georgenia sp. Z1491]|uniref:bifunctional [glutamine synthetase] adenylyltransferase/[glutamine synthetase]-adenylyl-L-tyrosine phosphorylase n=1 Tax=Georgenia sp. Z1491 TaxID=3416707 RepID=UPI003CF2FB8E
MAGGRVVSRLTQLRRVGIHEPRRAEALLDDPALAPYLAAEGVAERLLGHLASAGNPDHALLTLVRIAESAQESGDDAALRTALTGDDVAMRRLVAVVGASRPLGDSLVARPGDVAHLHDRHGEVPVLHLEPRDERAKALEAVGADPAQTNPVATVTGEEGIAALRRTYRRRLLEIAAADLTGKDSLESFPLVAASIADIVAGALDAALAVARAGLPDHGAGVRLAVIGMGKTGGREINYISDVDVVYVADPELDADGAPVRDEDETIEVATRLAGTLADAVGGVGPEPALWPLDANLRPEGQDGPLVRTLASHVSYYESWAKGWEFQALLKARPVAGDLALGEEYCAAVAPFVWSAASRENFVEETQKMRRRVEAHVPARHAERQLKLGKGGLRDVEFTVQLLQLVHGRTDETLRSRTTLEALEALAEGGYVARTDAATLDHHYRFLRVLEHRMQLWRLHRIQVVPSSAGDLEILGRAFGAEGITDGDALEKAWRAVSREVRRLHEEIYYRPLLPATARLSPAEASLAPDAAAARMEVIGFADPKGSLRHIAALTEGVSRRATIQRQLLPVMLGWFADAPMPDVGLLAFRRLSETIGTTHWYLALLRDSSAAAEALATVLATSRYVGDLLLQLPEAVKWLDGDQGLAPRRREDLEGEIDAMLRRREDATDAVGQARYLRRRETTRAAIAHVLEQAPRSRRRELADVADLALEAAVRVAARDATARAGLDEPPGEFLVVAMGRLGGREVGYSSDADVLFVHDPAEGVDEKVAADWARDVATSVQELLGATSDEPALPVDADLRPEGRSGPLVRTLASYAEYYERWVEVWERQALLRARPAAGSRALGERFMALVDAVRYVPGGIGAAAEREIRRVKGRVEQERMPRGVPPNRHLKLGPGALTDVEWTVQLWQLRHAGDVPALRVTSTEEALEALRAEGLVGDADAATLLHAWTLAGQVRDAVVQVSGRTTGPKTDVLPHGVERLETVARMLGYPSGHRQELEEDYLRAARRSRAVVERLFWE